MIVAQSTPKSELESEHSIYFINTDSLKFMIKKMCCDLVRIYLLLKMGVDLSKSKEKIKKYEQRYYIFIIEEHELMKTNQYTVLVFMLDKLNTMFQY